MNMVMRVSRDVVDSILICAVRAAYEGLVQQLQQNFEVTTVTSFDFELRKEDHGNYFPIKRVTAWRLERSAVLLLERQQADASQRLAEASANLQDLEQELGITAATVGDTLKKVLANWKGNKSPSMRTLEKHAARHLGVLGHTLDERDVRRMLRAMVVCKPDLLPAHLPTE
jgi:hypothetical protein